MRNLAALPTDLAEAVPAGNIAVAPRYSGAYRGWVLAVLVTIYTSGWLDRAVMNVLSQAIKVDLKLADWQLGVLTGLAFTVFYTVLGFPLARVAERYSRVRLISVCLVIWSGMTALCGSAGSFATLLLFRTGVGVGEAGCAPSAHSLITDYFEPGRRASALSVYNLGIPLGIMIGAVAGGWAAQHLSWRIALMIVGLPGLLLALVTWLTVKEPPRGYSEAKGPVISGAPPPSLVTVLKTLFAKPTFRHLAAGLSILIGSGGASNFLAPYYVRQFGLNYAEVGAIIGVFTGLTTAIGTVVGGYAADWLGRRDRRWYMWLTSLGTGLAMPVNVAAYLQHTWWAMAALLMVSGMLTATALTTAFGAMHNMVEPRMRATAAATLYFMMNIIGMGLGPVGAGYAIDLVSRHLFAAQGLGSFVDSCPGGVALAGSAPEIVRGCHAMLATGTQYVLLGFTPLALWGSLHYFLASRTIRRDLIV